MTQRGSFFDSVTGDRVYDAAAMARALDALIADGVVAGEGSELIPSESSPPAMTVRVGLGQAWVHGYYFEVYSTVENIAIAAAHATLPRIDRLVVRRSLSTRTIALAVITGTAAASPTAPALTQVSSGTWEMPIAQVLVPAAAASIVNANITDERPLYAKATGIEASLNITTGHDHDGTDSKTVPYANIASKPSTFAPSAHQSGHLPGGGDALTTAAPGASAVGDTAAAGAAASLARSDHRHSREGFAAPIASAPGDTQDAGAALTLARADHRHARESFATPAVVLGTAAAAGAAGTPIRSDSTIVAFDATVPSTQAAGDAAAAGAAAVAARRDHKHAMPAFGAVTAETTYGLGSGNGAAATLARSDHAHGTPAVPTTAQTGGLAAFNTPATAAGGKRAYVGTSTPTGASEGDLWFDG